MSTEHLLLAGAGAFFVACAAWALWPRGGGARLIQQVAAPLRQPAPVHSALQEMRQEGEARASTILMDRMANKHAEDIVKQFVEAISPKGPPPPPSSAQT